MIYGVGVDLLRVARVERSLEKFGARFAGRILTEREQAKFQDAPQPARFLAKRFAAKEAAVKALGLGFREGLGFHDVEIDHTPFGQPLLTFQGRAEHLARRAGILARHLSLSDEQDYVIAYVVLECGEQVGPNKAGPG